MDNYSGELDVALKRLRNELIVKLVILAFSLILTVVGLVLLVISIGWMASLGIFLFIFGNNIMLNPKLRGK